MKMLFMAVCTIFVALATSAFADPVGVYHVEGTNPGGKGAYSGEVAVERNGQTYTVVWVVGDTEFVGTGLGATNVNGSMIMGAADENNITLSVSYVSGGSFGLAFFVEQDNGQWKGIWTFGGSKKIGTEIWTPMK